MSEWGWEIFQCLIFLAGGIGAIVQGRSLESRVENLERLLLSHAIERVRFVVPEDEDDEEEEDDD